jgi:DNA-binding transcriptional LysR family regulator
VKALETRLDRPLFDRKGRKVELTPEGLSLVTRVRLSLALLSDAFDVAPWLEQNRLTVSTLTSIAANVLLPALHGFRERAPGIAIDLRCSSLLASLDAEIDVAIRFGPGGWSGVQSRHLADERLVPVASPHYRDGDLPRSVEQLRGCDLIRHPESTWQLWLEPLGWSVGDFPSTLTLDDSALVVDAAARGLGIGLARARLARADLASGRLVRLFDEEVPAEYSYWAVWSGSSPKRDLIETFVAWAGEQFRAVD